MAKDFSISAKFKGIDAISGVTAKITANLSKIVAVGTTINNKFKTVNKTVKSVANNVKGASVGAIIGLTAILAPAVAFSAQINELEAVSRSTAKQMAALTVQAKVLGSTTKFSATQAASAQTFLARAGFKTNEILAATPATLNLASAANMELARTADIASNIMGGFKLPATDMAKVADILAATTSSANVNLEELGESMKIAAPIALKMNVSMRETAAAVGLLGNAGIKGTMAGTALRSMMARLAAPTGRASKLINSLGVDVSDANGKIRPMSDLLIDISKSLKKLPQATQLKVMKEVFGLESLSAALNLVDKASSGELGDLANVLKNVDGRAKEMADTMNKGAAGAINNLRSASEGLALQIAEGGLLGKFTKIVTKLTVFVRSLTAADQSTLTVIATVLLLTAALAPVLIAISSMITILGVLSGGLGIVATAALVAGKAMTVGLLPALKKVVVTMILLAALNPMTAIIIGVTALIAVGVLLVKNWGSIKTFFKDLGQSIVSFFTPVFELFTAVSDIASKFSDAFKDEEITINAKIKPIDVPSLGLTQENFDRVTTGQETAAPEAAASIPSLFAGNQAAIAQQNGSANARATIEFLNANDNVIGRNEEGQQIDLNSGLTAAMGF